MKFRLWTFDRFHFDSQVTMLFDGQASNWALTKLEIENLGLMKDKFGVN